MSRPAILIFEKNVQRATALREIVETAGYDANTVYYNDEAVKVASKREFGLLVAGFDSLPVPDKLGKIKLIISAPDSRYLEMSKLSRKYHAPCIIYPYDAERVVLQLESSLAKVDVTVDTEAHEGEGSGIIGASKAIRETREVIAVAAKVPSTVLLMGETGTGKELAARALHDLGPRAKGPYVAVNCGAIPETLLETELFGHEKGAFTGAVKGRAGKYELAHNGTLFLDEIGDMPHLLQVKVLRLLESGTFYRVGAESPIKADVRLICATNRNIFELARTGGFRQDLLYRINVIKIDLPPLRERGGDISILAKHFLKNFAEKFKKTGCKFSVDALKKMQGYDWPGNIRQLQNAVERAMVRLKGKTIDQIDFGLEAEPPDSPPVLKELQKKDFAGMQLEVLAHYEKEYIKAILKETDGSIQKTCLRCGIDRKTLYLKMKQYGLDKKNFK